MMSVFLGLLSVAVSASFSLIILVRYRRKRAKHLAAWGTSLAMYAAACAALTWGLAFGWGGGSFRVYYLFGAILTVPYLGLGQAYLLWGERIGYPSMLSISAFSLAAVITILTAPMTHPPSGREIPSGREVYSTSLPPVETEPGIGRVGAIDGSDDQPVGRSEPLALMPRIMAVVGNIIGTVLVLIGTTTSAIRFARKRKRSPRAGKLALGNALIAAGVVVVASGGTGARFGETETLPLTLATGVSIIFAGFLIASGKRPADRDSTPDSTSGERDRATKSEDEPGHYKASDPPYLPSTHA